MSEQDRTASAAAGTGSRFRFSSPPAVRYWERPALVGGEALLVEISAGGLGLLLHSPPAPDAVLLVRLWDQGPGSTHPREARVVGTAPWDGFRQGLWRADCRLTPPLSDAELGLAWELGPVPA